MRRGDALEDCVDVGHAVHTVVVGGWEDEAGEGELRLWGARRGEVTHPRLV